MGYTTEYRGRRPNVFVSGTGQFLNATYVRTNERREGIIGIDHNIVLSSHNEFVDNAVIQEPLGSSDPI